MAQQQKSYHVDDETPRTKTINSVMETQLCSAWSWNILRFEEALGRLAIGLALSKPRQQ